MVSMKRTYVLDAVQDWADRTPDATALREAERTRTYEDLVGRARRMASAISAAARPDDVAVGFLGKNSIEFYEVWLGANIADYAIAPLNWRSPAAELATLIDAARLSVVVADAAHDATLADVRNLLARDLTVISFDATSADTPYEARIASSSPLARHAVDGAAIALLTHTSGTTGQPKGATFSHDAFRNAIRWTQEEPSMRCGSDDVALMVMPNFHLAGSWVSLPALYYGGTIAILPAFEPNAVLKALREWGVTTVCLVPTAIQFLLSHPEIHEADFGALRSILYAGSPISAQVLQEALDVFQCELIQFYGATETYMISILRPEQHDPSRPNLLTSCGNPLPGVSVRFVGKKGKDKEAGEIGEILVASDVMFGEYYENPEQTAAARDGEWYRTGDLGFVDEEGNIHLVDRAKDMIVTGGENVYSVEVERALLSHDSVTSAAVVGAPDSQWGERVVAFVTLAPGAEATEAELKAHTRARIAGYKVPKQVRIIDAMPLTASGKIQKVVLRDRVRAEEGEQAHAESAV
jgi:acyl-CoA synthetase (AMP-forming)/AMP-acid ligase II